MADSSLHDFVRRHTFQHKPKEMNIAMDNFCPQCGSLYQKGAAFCTSCSAPRGNAASNNSQQVSQNRETLLNGLGMAYQYFKEKQVLFDRIRKLTIKRNSYRPIHILRILFGGAPLVMMIIVVTIDVISFIIRGKYLISQIANPFTGLWVIIAFYITSIYIVRQISKKYISASQKRIDNKIYAAVSEIEVHYNNWQECPLPLAYIEPDAISRIYDVIYNGRAYSVKEAINLIIHDCQAQQFADSQRQVMQNQKEILSEIRWNAFFDLFKNV